MTDTTSTTERIRSANPVPSQTAFPTRALSAGDLLSLIDERSTTMTDTISPIHTVDQAEPPRRNRGPLVALAAAAILILVLGIGSYALLRNDDGGVVDQPTTTTTVATTTTLGLQSPLPADTPPVEVVAAIQAAWDVGDTAAAEALIRPDSALFADGAVAGLAEEVWYRYATGMTVERDCAQGRPPELEQLVAAGTVVTCTEILTSGLQPGTVAGGGTVALEVLDGWILDGYIMPDYVGGLAETDPATQPNAYLEYRDWLRDNHPDRFGALFDPVSLTMTLDTPEARDGHREMVLRFLTATTPRSPGALPADTPPLEVVAAIGAAWEVADIDAAEAIMWPESQYFTEGLEAGVADEVWYRYATRMTVESDCTEGAWTELAQNEQPKGVLVTCDDTLISGLQPGTVVGGGLVALDVWIGMVVDVYIHPDYVGALANTAALDAYRSWVRDTLPDRYSELFNAASLTMTLDTPEAREAHRAAVEEYVAATGGN
jgi:hypothetical protein